MNDDVKAKVKEVIFEQCEERSDDEMSAKDKIQTDANLVKLVAALNEMEKLEQDRLMKQEELVFEKEKFVHDKGIDSAKVDIERDKVLNDQVRIDKEVDIRRYESDAADKRAKLENETNLEKISSEKKTNIFKTVIYGLGILAGIALHIGDVNAEKELGYDVDDRVKSFDKIHSSVRNLIK